MIISSLCTHQKNTESSTPFFYSYVNVQAARISILGGAIILLISALAMSLSPYGSTSFWISAAELGLSSASVILGCVYFGHNLSGTSQSKISINSLSSSQDENFVLDVIKDEKCKEYASFKSVEEYRFYLSQDEKQNSCVIPAFVEKFKQEGSTASRLKQVLRDEKGKIIYCINGEVIQLSQLKKYGNFLEFINQSPISEILSILSKKYNNLDLNIVVGQRTAFDHLNISNTQFDLIEKLGNRYLNITQMFQITHLNKDKLDCLIYIKATMKINFQSGDALIDWEVSHANFKI